MISNKQTYVYIQLISLRREKERERRERKSDGQIMKKRLIE